MAKKAHNKFILMLTRKQTAAAVRTMRFDVFSFIRFNSPAPSQVGVFVGGEDHVQ
jgi:hypothetical protein